MNDVMIRKATMADIPDIITIYNSAKAFMRRSGNMTQWINGYPGEREILNDIAKSNLYVGLDAEGTIELVFAFIIGNDPTYDVIDGSWLNDEPYGTIHRIASLGRRGGAVDRCVDFCLSKVENIRIDTHRDNLPMFSALERCGFKHCGVIICADGTPREAFQLRKH